MDQLHNKVIVYTISLLSVSYMYTLLLPHKFISDAEAGVVKQITILFI